jgi:hypothetical protein
VGWEGFFIVGLLDLGAPPWLVGAAAVGLLVVGGVLFNLYTRRIVPRPVADNQLRAGGARS